MNSAQDIIIIGAGFVGLTLAYALAQQGKRIALIEAKDLTQKKQQHANDGRAIALTRKSQQILLQFNIWPYLSEYNALNEVCISQQGSFGKLYLKEKNDFLGYVLPAPQLGSQLLALCQQEKNITWFSPATLESITQDEHSITAHLNDEAISAKLLIVAEGTESLSRTMQSFATWTRDYEQNATVANVSLTHPKSGIAYQRFSKQGTLALLPLKKNRFTLVWTSPDQTLADEDFLARMQAHLGTQLGQLHDLGPRQQYPLKALFVEKAFAGRLLLMGNAAHTLTPIAAQGFNLTLRDMECLVNLLNISDLNTDSVEPLLAHYQQLRLKDQKNMLRFTDKLVTLLHKSQLSPLRSLGLFALNLPFLKQRFLEHLSGY